MRKEPSLKQTSKFEGDSNTFVTSLNNSQVYPGHKKLGFKSVERQENNRVNNNMLLSSHQRGNSNNKSMHISKFNGTISTNNSINKFRNSIFSKTGKSLPRKLNSSVVNSPIKHNLG